ncbi:MAG: hypothetical protein ABI574_05725 [Burkholderiales bacterium]
MAIVSPRCARWTSRPSLLYRLCGDFNPLHAGPALHFRCSAVERGIEVLAGGEAVFG